MSAQNFKPEKNPEKKFIFGEDPHEYGLFLNRFLEVCTSVGEILDMDAVTGYFVNKLAELLEVNRVSFMLLDDAKQELFVRASKGLDQNLAEAKVKLGEAFSGWVAKEGNPLIVKDVEVEFPDLSKDRASRYTTKSFVIVPVKVKEGIIGVLSLTDKKDGSVFSDSDLTKIMLLSSLLALHIQNIRLLEKTGNLTISDPLTSLFNHRYFMEQLLEEIYRAERYKRPLSLMMFDIDDFSQFNQNFSYAAGDSALKQIAKIIKVNIRQADLVCRYGPEEFMVLLPETKLKDAAFVADKIRQIINESIFTPDRKSAYEIARLTVSVGLAEHRIGWRKEELVQHASEALLEAKGKGKNCLSIFK